MKGKNIKIYDNYYHIIDKKNFEYLEVSMSLKSFKDAKTRMKTHPHLSTFIPKTRDEKHLKDMLLAIYLQRDNLLDLYKGLKDKFYELNKKLNNVIKEKNKKYYS